MTNSLFPETPWSLIAAQVGADDTEQASALRRLLSIYWPPVLSAIRDGWDVPADSAEALCHDFLATIMQDKQWLATASNGGLLRHALCRALERYMNDNAERAAGRDSGIAIDRQHVPTEIFGDPEEVYDMQWTLLVFQRALTATSSVLGATAADALRVFEAVDVAGDAEEAADDSALAEARRMFRRELLLLVCDYVSDESAARDELAWLLDERRIAGT